MKLAIAILTNLAFRIMPAMIVLLAGSIGASAFDRAGDMTLSIVFMSVHAICAFSTIFLALVSIGKAA